MTEYGIRAKKAEKFLLNAGTAEKNRALGLIADELEANKEAILKENEKDLLKAEQGGMNQTMLDRLRLTPARISSMAQGVREIIALPDPCGRVLQGNRNPKGFTVEKVTVPLGVIAVIYEARPNVTADAAALCLKSGNAVILRGGKEAFLSNNAITECMRRALEKADFEPDCIQLVQDTTRESATALMHMNEYIDVLIPRGGAGLIRACVENSTVPVIETGTGNCHIYVDRSADIEKAAQIIYNAKVSRPSVCNACESLVIHRDILEEALPVIKAKLDEADVLMHADREAAQVVSGTVEATEEDFHKEYLGYEISVKTVGSTEEAIEHINACSTGHSECIVTESYTSAELFLRCIDSAAVYVNVSTRFTDGGEFGFGAEIGISTQKLHARGPLGLPELTTVKYLIRGSGQIR